MITLAFLALLGVAAAVAMSDWRKGWYAAILIGVLQDPARKLTPGTPVIFVMSIMVVYAAIIIGSASRMRAAVGTMRGEYPRLYQLFQFFIFFLLIAAVNGLLTFGFSEWKAPALGLFIYCAPLPAVILGYQFLRSEEDLLRFFRFYSVLTSVALITVPLEFMRVNSRVLGTVGLGEDWIRHLPGLQIRILSGSYRSPDIMAWHAATLCVFALTLAVRARITGAWWWVALSGWGFLNCLLSGRRKMLYIVVVFAVVFLWRYWRRFTVMQMVAFGLAALVMWFVVNEVSTSEGTQVYAKGARVSRVEVLQRLEGGAIEAVQQHGIWGAGLGAATQGARHVVSSQEGLGWQEGGAGKLALELGLPGLLFLLYFAYVAARTMAGVAFRGQDDNLRLLRIALFAILAANAASFLVSHQPYTDGVLILTNAFLIGALLATPKLSSNEQPLHREIPIVPAGRPLRPSARPRPA